VRRRRRRAFNGKANVKFSYLCYFIRSKHVPHFTLIHEHRLFMLSTCRGFSTKWREKSFLASMGCLGEFRRLIRSIYSRCMRFCLYRIFQYIWQNDTKACDDSLQTAYSRSDTLTRQRSPINTSKNQ